MIKLLNRMINKRERLKRLADELESCAEFYKQQALASNSSEKQITMRRAWLLLAAATFVHSEKVRKIR